MITFAGPILSSVNTHEVNKVLYYPRCVQHSSDVLRVQLLVHHSHWPWLQLRWCSCHTSAAGSCARYNYMVKILKWKLLNSLFFQISGMFFSIGQCFTLHDCCPDTVEGDNKCGVCCGRYILPLMKLNYNFLTTTIFQVEAQWKDVLGYNIQHTRISVTCPCFALDFYIQMVHQLWC